jgi:archaeoflavoprotein AfpA
MVLKKRFAWGITGSGHEITEILDTMKNFSNKHDEIDVRVFISKSGEQVLTWYRLIEDLKTSLNRVKVESSPNTPFLAGELQSRKYDFLLVAPTSSNSTAKIALGIGDTLITNAVNMATKARVPVYVYPCEVGNVETTLPNGKVLRLDKREVDMKYIEAIEKDDGLDLLKNINEIKTLLENYYQSVSLS